MNKLLGISASSRLWGNCEASVKSILLSAVDWSAQTEFVRLCELKIDACRGCFRCLAKGGACPIEDDLDGLLAEVAEADALVLAAPVYFMSAAAPLIALLDRLLAMAEAGRSRAAMRRAVTLTIMGNREWRGVAEPVVNMAVSLLGFEVAESMSLAAQGPGEILGQADSVKRFQELGKALATGESIDGRGGGGCPVCRSDFFRIEPPSIVCPICGSLGDLETYIKELRFVRRPGEVRWGLPWLHKHIGSWIKPSIRRYREEGREPLRHLQDLKKRYSRAEGKG